MKSWVFQLTRMASYALCLPFALAHPAAADTIYTIQYTGNPFNQAWGGFPFVSSSIQIIATFDLSGNGEANSATATAYGYTCVVPPVDNEVAMTFDTAPFTVLWWSANVSGNVSCPGFLAYSFYSPMPGGYEVVDIAYYCPPGLSCEGGEVLNNQGTFSVISVQTGGTPLQITTASLPTALSGQPYNSTIMAAGGSGSGDTWSLSAGSLPDGFTFSSEGTCGDGCVDVVLSSTGTPAATPGTYDFTVQVTDSAGNLATQPLILVVTTAAQTPEILFNGNDVTGTTQQAIVGQQISLTAIVPLPPDGATIQSQTWLIPGDRVGGYTPTPSNPVPGQLLPVNTNAQNTTFYWVQSSNSTSYMVQYDYTLTDGTTGTLDVNFAVAAAPVPTGVTVTEWAPNSNWIYTAANGELVLGFGNPIQRPPGIDITVPTNPGAGAFQFVQLVLGDSYEYDPEGSCKTKRGLDTRYPYPLDPTHTYATDSPAIPLLPRTFTATDNFRAQMFVMWTPNIANSIPVPVGSVSWGFSETSEFNGDQWETPTDMVSRAIFMPNTKQYPLWNNLATTTCH